jgi:hypothetical protein
MEQTIIVECSRQSSLEATTFNNQNLAEWTNDCGAGIVLDIGDKIQVHSGFVSETGAQAGEIEIKERDRINSVQINVSKDIEYRNQFPTFLSASNASADNAVENSREIYTHGAEYAGNELRPIKINDGETNIVYSPYKTANGEFYATLPRRHIGLNNFLAVSGQSTNVPENIRVKKTDNPYDGFDANQGETDSVNQGACAFGNVRYGNLSGSNPDYNFGFTDAWQFCPADYKLVNENKTYVNPDLVSSPNGDFTYRKGMILNDNSRYTIFRAKRIFRTAEAAFTNDLDKRSLLGGSATNQPEGTERDSPEYFDAVDLRDPATLYDWEQVRNLITIKSKPGFNKPTDVATELTQQLNLRGEAVEKKIIHKVESFTLPVTQKFADKTLYKYYESPCYKAYNCATNIWNDKNWYSFTDIAGSTDATLDAAHTYMSMYQHIGIKRPELHIQGRATNGSRGFLKPARAGDGGNTPQNAQCLNLGLRWDEPTLTKLNELFKVQAKYPELFTGITQHGPHSETTKINWKITPGNHRFLHFNKQDDETDDDAPAGSYRHNPRNFLGYDLYGYNAQELNDTSVVDNPVPTQLGYHYDETMATYPVFFDFNPNTENLGMDDVGYCEDAGGGVSDFNDLAYGWARKMRISSSLHPSNLDTFYIGIQFTKTGNGVPEFLYNQRSHIALSTIDGNDGRRFGWDYHFSAYGNPCMVLYSGLVNNASANLKRFCYDEKEYYRVVSTLNDRNNDGVLITSTDRDTAAMYHTLQLGADNPAIGYDTNEERFFLSNLHISERLGNPSDAGKVDSSSSSSDGVNANANADASVYKINKRMLGTNYCPNVSPYSSSLQINGSATQGYPPQTGFSNNLEPFTPYGEQGGMFIEEVAVPEEIWKNNLLGVLGFSYEQFNNTDTTRQVSIKDRFNATNLKSLTTQAPINVEDLPDWNKNGFGNSIFGLIPGLSYERSLAKKDIGDLHINIIPPATIILPDNANSTRITAVDLPTKTARPYYAIRSNIIPQNQFIGGNGDYTISTAGAVNRPVVAVVNKINGYGDFYSSESQQLTFTNTEKRVITSIKTSIHDPDGSYSKVNQSSSVIYKIMKTLQIDLTPVKTLLESKNKQQQEQGDLAASMIKDPSTEKPDYNYALDGLKKDPPKKFITEEEFFAARSSE